jgi:GT2 family glycosyltransferase
VEPTDAIAPPVVAVMVVHEPGPWFDDTLDALARQDYGNLKCLFLVTSGGGTSAVDDTQESSGPNDVAQRIRDRVPNAFVRAISGNPGFGAAANEVVRLVEGDNGFFCFLHDDVALDDNAVRMLVEELYRSNAGIVGPKLVMWDEPLVLQHIGLGVDRFGEIDTMVEPGEFDQEQHDAVRDVFALPTACLLVRADLFRTVGGFDPAVEYVGDDVDLCWRAHLSGARVLVVPAARARHREQLALRRPDLPLDAMAARARMRSVATLTGGRRLPWVGLQLLLVTIAESIVGLVTGRVRQAAVSLRAMVGMMPRTPGYFSRRRGLAALRLVPDTEVAGLQLRGSARMSSYLRARDSRPLDPDAGNERRWRESAGSAPAIAWITVVVLLVVGSRHLITDGVPAFGQFLQFPASPWHMLTDYASGWSSRGLGSATAAPTGLALLGVGSVITLFHMGLLHTVLVVGLLFLGALGAWRLAAVFPTARARITVLIVYAAVPLPSNLLSSGRWGALVGFAAAPWALNLMRRVAGLDTRWLDNESAVDGIRDVPPAKRRWLLARLALLTAVAGAFSPAFALVILGMGVVLALATLLCGGAWRVSVAFLGAGATALVVAVIVNLPWVLTLVGKGGWTAIVGVATTSGGLGVRRLVQMRLGTGYLGTLGMFLLVPVFVAPLVARSWRFAWAVRAAALVVVFGGLAVLDDRGALPFRLPDTGLMLVPMAVGIALAAGCVAAAFEADVLAGSFGWRQPLGLLSAVAIVLGIVPGVLAVGGGRWGMPTHTIESVLGQLPTNPADGDYRVLWVGDPRVIPVAAWTYQPGIGYAVTDDGALVVDENWGTRPTTAERDVADALASIARGDTLRGGRLLAPFGIRYVVIPLADGVNGTIAQPLPAPNGLVDVLDDQLDMASPLTRPPNYIVYENTAYTPTRSQLTVEGAAASKQAGGEALAQADLRGSKPFGVGAPDRGPARGAVGAGTLHVAVQFDSNWHLSVDGRSIAPRHAFGSTLGFDMPAAGNAVLEFDTPLTRSLWVLVQLVLWTVLVLVAAQARLPRRRRRVAQVADDGIVADLTAPIRQPVFAPPTGAVHNVRGADTVDPDDEPAWTLPDDAPTGEDQP